MKVAASIVQARRKSLAQLLENHRYLPLAEVCSRLGISQATARRDLSALAHEKNITRTYGGALGKFDMTFASFADRRALDHGAKTLIAEKARRLIKPHTTCFFDSGTTIYALAEALHRQPVSGLCAVTNNLPVVAMLGRSPEIEIHLLGGRFLQRQSILLGAAACHSAKLWEFDQMFLSVEGFSQGGLWVSPEVAGFQRTLIARARRVVVCAHAAKLNCETGVFLAPWRPKFQLVTDATADAEGPSWLAGLIGRI